MNISQAEFNLLLYFIIVFSAVFHEYMHAWTAFMLGDPTAKYEGRLTLNPIPHLDPWGTVILPLLLLFLSGGFIGWAKPVPYNPYNLRSQKWGSALVGLAGPATNLFLAIVFGLLIRFEHIVAALPGIAAMQFIFPLIVSVNIFLALFNLLPIPPLDGSKFFASYLPRNFETALSTNPFLSLTIAILIAMLFLPKLSSLLFSFIVGA